MLMLIACSIKTHKQLSNTQAERRAAQKSVWEGHKEEANPGRYAALADFICLTVYPHDQFPRIPLPGSDPWLSARLRRVSSSPRLPIANPGFEIRLPHVHSILAVGRVGLRKFPAEPLSVSRVTEFAHSLSNSICNPSRTAPAAAPLSLPVNSTSSALSTVRIWDTFTTLALGRLASPFLRSTLPGAFALLRFEVIRHTTLVRIALRLKISFWTTTQGCRSAGA